MVPELRYEGIYTLDEKNGERIFNDCYSAMGKESSYDHEPMLGNGLHIYNVTDEIEKRVINLRYNDSLKLPNEEVVSVFYTYGND